MKFKLMILLLITGFNCTAFDCQNNDAKTDSAAEYLNKMPESLVNVKIQLQKIKSLQLKLSTDATDVMVSLKELKAAYECSAGIISVYKKSKIDNISKSSESLSQSYQMLGSGVDESIADFKLALDGKSKLTESERAEKSADTMINIKNKWKLAMTAIALGTYAAVGKVNPKTKKIDTLLISKSERDEIVKTLKSVFTLPLAKSDSDPIDAAADIYYGFLSQQWKFK